MLNNKITPLRGLLGFLLIIVCTGYAGNNIGNTHTVKSVAVSDQSLKKTVIQDLCWSPDGRYIYFSAMKVAPDYSDYSPDLWTVYRFDTHRYLSRSQVF